MNEDLLLFYAPNGCSLGSVVACEWLGTPYRLCRIEHDDHERPDYRRLNPLGLSPLLRVGRRTFGENVAILHHLNAIDAARGRGFVQGTADFDRMNHALSVLATGLHPAFEPFFHVDRYADDEAARATVKRVALGKLRKKLAYVDEHLTPPGFLFGRPTLVEAFLFGIVRWADELFDWRKDYPSVARCQEEMAKEPAVRFALGREGRREVPSVGAFRGEVALASVTA